jgi:tetratricopeptide (TPR) repeat protein
MVPMKKIFYLFGLCCSVLTAYAQNPDMTGLLQKISLEKNDSIRFYLAFSGLTVSETNPVLDMENAEIIFIHGQKTNDKICQVLGLACLGYDYRAFGNTARSLEYNLKAKVVAETTNDDRLIFPVYNGLATNYLDLGEYSKALAYNRSSLEKAACVEVNMLTIVANLTMGEIYLAVNKMDSALIYAQKAYEESMSTGIKDYLGGIYGQMGIIQSKLNNSTLALSYLKLSLEEGYKIKSPKYINIPYTSIAEYFLNAGQKDSAIAYSLKAIAAVRHSPFETMVIKPAKLLTDIYRNVNIDSAFKYSEMYKAAKDSLFSIKAIQQTQLMTFEEEARQQERGVVKAKEEDQRKQNIQYAILALGIITFIILFLILSRSFIANTKLIEFLGIIALLIVFEFFNLLLHPVLENITHHTPVFMLLALVCIASLLVPMHHRLEKWATQKLVEKNKRVRLAAAKKTIAELENGENS